MNTKTLVLLVAVSVCLALCISILPWNTATPDPTDPTIGEIPILSLQISEICAKNNTILTDNFDNTPDYIELHNTGTTISLAGFRLTDGKVTSAPFGDIILAAGEYRVIFLSDVWTGFGISASGGDTIQLLDPTGSIVAQTTIMAMEADQVMLLDNGSYTLSYDASPGFANDETGVAAFRTGHVLDNPQLLISEILINNVSSLPDENGVYSDVLELYNASDKRIYLGHYYLSDDVSQRYRYRLPDVYLEAGSYLLLYCDSGNYISANGNIHTNFSLSHGETLCLTQVGTGGYVTVQVQSINDDRSFCLLADGKYGSYPVSLGYRLW